MSGYQEIKTPWSNVYGLCRSILAAGTAATLLVNDADLLFRPAGTTIADQSQLPSLMDYSLFSLVPNLELARWLAIAVLLLVASGWRPRVTALPHWWVSASFAVSCVPVDGGDHITAMLTMVLVPLALSDSRPWHWSAPESPSPRFEARRAVGISTVHALRVLVSLIYLHAGVGKMFVSQWLDGTALYYWFLDPQVGSSGLVRETVSVLFTNGYVLTLSTWSVMVFELALFLALMGSRRFRGGLLVAGMGFHFGIIVVHGLVSFFFAMAAALVILLRHVDEPFAWVDTVWVAIRRRLVPAPIELPRRHPRSRVRLRFDPNAHTG
ncbi:MAG: sporulation-delaying protein SdpB family protein [Myxococcota bacterium]